MVISYVCPHILLTSLLDIYFPIFFTVIVLTGQNCELLSCILTEQKGEHVV